MFYLERIFVIGFEVGVLKKVEENVGCWIWRKRGRVRGPHAPGMQVYRTKGHAVYRTKGHSGVWAGRT
jgi:hypothetical protein